MKFFQILLLVTCSGRLESLPSSAASFVKFNRQFKNTFLYTPNNLLTPFSRTSAVNGFDSSAAPTGVILPRDTSQRSLEEEELPDDDYEGTADFRRANMPDASVTADSKQLSKAARELTTEFSRYKLLRDFLEGDVTWGEMHPVIALCLGFRVRDGLVQQDETVEPLGWYGLGIVPDLSNLSEGHFASRMTADLPEDEGATDIVIETLAGLEMYQKMKASPDGEVQRRILLGKWLYVQGFFDDKFPSVKRFIPAHMANRGNDDDDDDDE